MEDIRQELQNLSHRLHQANKEDDRIQKTYKKKTDALAAKMRKVEDRAKAEAAALEAHHDLEKAEILKVRFKHIRPFVCDQRESAKVLTCAINVTVHHRLPYGILS